MKPILTFITTMCLCAAVYAQNTPKHDATALLEYYQNQRYADAFTYLHGIYGDSVADVKILSALAYTSQMSGQLPQAEKYYLRILQTDSLNIPVLFNLGNINNRRGNNAKAIIYYLKIIKKDSTNFNVYRQLSTLAKNVGDMGSSIYYMQQANNINPLDGDVAFDLSTFYLAIKQLDQAEKVLSPALAADSTNLTLILGKAKTTYQQGKTAETIALCNKLIQEGDQSGAVISMLGTSYYLEKKYQLCIDTYNKLTDDTQTEASLYYTGMAYKGLKDQRKAIKYLEDAIEKAISPTVDTYYGEIAESYDRLNKTMLSLAAYQKALEYNERPVTLYALAILYDDKLKNKKQAIRYYKKYLASKPPKNHQQYMAYSSSRIEALSR
ncbi:tetratricopeptide repeat protein [Mucilaginibacter sp. UR6-1]|uniref:tetratricopeptide repeat protein n=1 Tax=Mucilaginibacter sp. UR6-1 TaxID=1435643 RepID=UPI001E3C9270|nr:tetratricopeptide repeat protein [Mucilaginibacter sp. UR6-1]MCC8409242.1 tetratricopeptide repeat protein [Mucilaginibacter sp. UR6-1]